MNHEQILSAMAAMQYKADVRNLASVGRQSQFRLGWAHGASNEVAYAETTLNRLTWRNLGYRLARAFGPRGEAEIDGAFEYLAVRLQDEIAKQGK